MKDKDHLSNIRGLLIKMKRDLERFAESDKATPRMLQAKEFVIKQIEEYVDNTEAWIEQLQDDLLVYNIANDVEIERMKEHIFMLEATLLIHGVRNFPMWLSKGPDYLLSIVLKQQKDNACTIPTDLINNPDFKTAIKPLWK